MFRVATFLALLVSLIGARPVAGATGPEEPVDAVCRDAETAVGRRNVTIKAAPCDITRLETPAVVAAGPINRCPPVVYCHHREGGGGARAP